MFMTNRCHPAIWQFYRI